MVGQLQANLIMFASADGRLVRSNVRKVTSTMYSILSKSADVGVKWVIDQHEGVFVLHLQEAGFVDHCVVVDCLERMIFYSEESCTLDILEASLRMCSGDGAISIRVAAILFIERL